MKANRLARAWSLARSLARASAWAWARPQAPIWALCTVMLTTLACTGKPVQLTAQAGSTIVIPLNLGARADNALGLDHIGYGVTLPQGMAGTEYSDPQRGKLVVELEGSGGRTLLTRWVFLADPPAGSKLEQIRTWAGREVFLVADIPADLSGVFSLELYWERFNPEAQPGQENERELALGEPYFGQMTIIPSPLIIDHDDDPGTADRTFTGTSTPFLYAEGLNDWNYGSYGFQPENAIPLPSFGIEIHEPAAPASHGGSWLAYAEIDVTYPEDTISIQDVVLSESHRGRVWWVDHLQSGSLRVYVTNFIPFTNEQGLIGAYVSGARDLKASPLRVVFDLKSPGSDLLETADLTTTLTRATDELGNDLLAVGSGWALSASSASATEIQ